MLKPAALGLGFVLKMNKKWNIKAMVYNIVIYYMLKYILYTTY